MNFLRWLPFFLFLFSSLVKAQHVYTFQNDIPVTVDNVNLRSPFSGGFVAPQYSEIDLDNDGVKDLFVFDRSSNKVSTYLFQMGEYVYTPYYESRFPKDLKNWVLLRDYNCDGKMDLFTSSILGISLYENTTIGNELSWTLIYQTIYTEGSNGQINLQLRSLDLPSIVDVDGDGDIDILTFNFATRGGIEYHENRSVQTTGNCGLDLVRTTKRYGEFEECTCDTYAFGSDACSQGGRENHTGSRSILSFYGSNSATQDLLIGQEHCLYPGYLSNTGTITNPLMTHVDFNFPDSNNPLRMEYPAFYSIDLDKDGDKDLVASPNSFLTNGTQDYTQLNYRYMNNGNGNYSLVTNSFLKEEMIDVGFMSSPALADVDFDGDDDLFVGSGKNEMGASLWFYSNVGFSELPNFELISKDYLRLEVEGNERIRPQFLDVNRDELVDLVLYKVINAEMIAEAYIHSGQPNPYSASNKKTIPLPSNYAWDAPHLFKLGNKWGLLIGKQDGNLEYYTTTSDIDNIKWDLVSEAYLDIEKDFLKRNLRIILSDFDANGSQDLLSTDDSGDVILYSNFLNENSSSLVNGFDSGNSSTFGLDFGNQANLAVANLFSAKEPVIIIGLLQGGILVLKNTNQTGLDRIIPHLVNVYPNPILKNELVIQSNKSGTAKIFDTVGKQVIGQIILQSGVQHKIPLLLNEGVYLVEIVSATNEKKTTRIVVID